ncbi:E3 ubiquitin-protein ligase TRIM38-like [Talpa occidentalis]|uniref:E3 ubiquitin-protein ligase TRIM38-like n=1 Tax=Talpa occidentalis TaxID=50954 RepID=UPI00188DDE33|nr:E3 ubiquitin-protein ligase TRIM38-like [Talpa occidentalis]XP_037374865.1 E3 ubiquitin-protein ligase TRIM38-like [Talpa occidentalis]XP_037374866.1 E3 ubiquitin-protein ligase TRIM38-like [Talpa occidentalis]XP_037374867.1 E3 ubiquitin-protein ligase TRIM38-like [Talpa occidentalis]XP_037374868.1 E3 ubiquitin-protein ligase TRIM38-like [Talpa occidentalis]XP_054554353.1 E3 ubiquitin-protein ligase TRIM38-like [Talpa occidentalis]XP_054554354.1 E3 ubiquitin-protein ligase TRIM38-like [Tal
MASLPAIRKMREEATCSICQQLMKEPVSVNCGHSFCRQCIDNIIGQQYFVTSFIWRARCPLCQTSLQRESVRPNKHLENLIERIQELERERLCEEHGEQLCLFCEDDEQLICWRCERSPQHRGHRTALVEDVCPGYKDKLQGIVTNLKETQDHCTSAKLFMAEQITAWKENIELRRQEIKSEFWNLHCFLHEEERAYLWRLEKEEEKLLGRLQDSEASLDNQSCELEKLVLELEKKCQGSAQNLLQGVKDTLNWNSDVKLKLPEIFCLEPQTVCHVSELYFDVKKMLRHFQVSVTLDPNTAHRELILSEDRRHVTRGGRRKKHISSKRLCSLPCVLGCEGFTSGRHYFEVDVGEGSGWDLGVCLENVHRDRDMTPEPQSGFWAIRLCQENGYMALTSPPTPLSLRERPLLVGVFLDCEAGLVSFYNMNTGSHIFTFPRASFSGTLRPYFLVNHSSSLFLPPPLESI